MYMYFLGLFKIDFSILRESCENDYGSFLSTDYFFELNYVFLFD